MSKGLEALETIKNITIIPNYEENGVGRIVFASEIYKEQIDLIEKELEDFEWLKEHIGFQLLDNLSTSEKIKLLEIMGVEYNQGDWHIKL